MNKEAVCIACDSSENESMATLKSEIDNKEYEAMRCRKCGLVYAFPMPKLDFEKLQSLYDADFTEVQRQYDNESDELIAASHRQMQLVEALIQKGRALNVGAMGAGSKVIRDRGWQLSVVEVSESAAETARQKWGLDVAVCRIEDVDFPDGSFDFIKLGHVIEHLENPKNVLKKMHSLLREGGLLLIDTDNASGLRTSIEIRVRKLLGEDRSAALVKKLTGKNLHRRYGRLTPPIHVYTFSPLNLTMLLEQAGFNVNQVLEPSWGDPTWFPLKTSNRPSLAERMFIYVESIGTKFLGHGEDLVVFAQKK